jgi:hypothetical protein
MWEAEGELIEPQRFTQICPSNSTNYTGIIIYIDPIEVALHSIQGLLHLHTKGIVHGSIGWDSIRYSIELNRLVWTHWGVFTSLLII